MNNEKTKGVDYVTKKSVQELWKTETTKKKNKLI